MMCKTDCKREAGDGTLCAECDREWCASPEFTRCYAVAQGAPKAYVPVATTALMDFCTRVRAERMNGGQNETR